MKKIFILFGMLVLTPCCTMAAVTAEQNTKAPDITVKDTTSLEFIRNQGYSSEVHRLIEVRNVNPLTPIPVEEKRGNYFSEGAKKVGHRVLETIDPTLEDKHFGSRDINYSGVTVDDL